MIRSSTPNDGWVNRMTWICVVVHKRIDSDAYVLAYSSSGRTRDAIPMLSVRVRLSYVRCKSLPT